MVLKSVRFASRKSSPNAVPTEISANAIGTLAATSVRNTISSTSSATAEADELARALLRRRLLGVAGELGPDARGSERRVIVSSSLTTFARSSWKPSFENCTSA